MKKPDLTPPRALIEPTKKEFHGKTLQDPYGWMRDPAYPELEDTRITDYLEQENQYFGAAFEPLAPKIDELFEELKGRIKDDEFSVPTKKDGYEYWWKFQPGAQYRTWYRRPVGTDEERVCLDEPALAEGHEYFSLGGLAVDPSHNTLLYTLDTDGGERYTAYIKDADGTEAKPLGIDNTLGSPVWSQDGSGFYYLELNDQWRPFRVRFRSLKAPLPEDTIVYEETDEGFFVGLELTQDRRRILISSADHSTSEVHYKDAHNPEDPLRCFMPRKDGLEYHLDHAEDRFFMLINDTHKNNRILTCPSDDVSPSAWSELVAASDERYIQSVTPFKEFYVIEERFQGLDRVVVSTNQGDSHVVAFPSEVCACGMGGNPEYDTSTIRLHYESMINPSTVFDYQVSARELISLKIQEIPSGFDSDLYQTTRLMAPARDGALVPVSIVHRKDLQKPAPLYLYAYGAYGNGLSPSFSTHRLSLLNRGFAFAIAHIRGGDELGYHWYESGKLKQRWNTFNDFIDVAEHLIAKDYTEAGRIAISGGSAGGELMGVVANQRPELWGAVIANVPFVDVLNTMLDAELPLTPIEWPEWGNPIEDSEAFDFIAGYSPYDNVEAKNYPPMLITGGLNDPRVTYWEPAKWVAKLRATKTDDSLLLLKTNMGAGHGGKSGRWDSIRELAEEFMFVLETVN